LEEKGTKSVHVLNNKKASSPVGEDADLFEGFCNYYCSHNDNTKNYNTLIEMASRPPRPSS